MAGAIHDQELVLEEKGLRNYGTDATRSEQPGQRGDQVDNKNGQIAHRIIVAGWEILRNHGRNNNSPSTGHSISEDYCVAKIASRRHADWKPDPAESGKTTAEKRKTTATIMPKATDKHRKVIRKL